MFLLDVASGRVDTLLAHLGSVTRVTFSPDGRWIATSSADTTARIWTRAGELWLDLEPGDDGIVNWVAWSPSGSRWSTAHSTGNVRTWPLLDDARLGALADEMIFRDLTPEERARRNAARGR